jgi:hypothetical protein
MPTREETPNLDRLVGYCVDGAPEYAELSALKAEVERLRDENRNHEIRLKDREFKINSQRDELKRLQKSKDDRADFLRRDDLLKENARLRAKAAMAEKIVTHIHMIHDCCASCRDLDTRWSALTKEEQDADAGRA